MNPFRGLFQRVMRHRKPREMPAHVRRRMYRELLIVVKEEERARLLLRLPTTPRVCVVDEERVVMLCPGDRGSLALDRELQRVRDEQRDRDEQESGHEAGEEAEPDATGEDGRPRVSAR